MSVITQLSNKCKKSWLDFCFEVNYPLSRGVINYSIKSKCESITPWVLSVCIWSRKCVKNVCLIEYLKIKPKIIINEILTLNFNIYFGKNKIKINKNLVLIEVF